MPILVDGDNLLGTWPGRRRSDAERRALAFELGRLAARLRRRVVVVFDGPADLAGQYVDVEITGATAVTLFGKLAGERRDGST